MQFTKIIQLHPIAPVEKKSKMTVQRKDVDDVDVKKCYLGQIIKYYGRNK